MRKVLAIVASGLALASCSSSDWDFLKPSGDLFQSTPPTGVLRFESEPAGAEARLPNGQACRTPCALAVPEQNTTVAFSLNGYLPQSVAVQAALPLDMRTDPEVTTAPTPTFDPNPVYAELQPVPPPKRTAPRRSAPRPAAAPRPASVPPPAPSGPIIAPAPQPASPWPAPAR